MLTLHDFDDAPRWVLWKAEQRDGKPTKVPYAINLRQASCKNPATWANRGAVRQVREQKPDYGEGFILGDNGDGSSTAGIDLDACIDADGRVKQWAQDIIACFDTYAETSPSGTGIKLFFLLPTADVEAFRGKHGKCGAAFKQGGNGAGHPPGIELYLRDRYFAVTGNARREPQYLAERSLEDVAWLLDYAARQFPNEGGPRGHDNSRSARAFRLAAKIKRKGGTCDSFICELFADRKLAAWAKENGERGVQRAWDRAGDGHDPGAAETHGRPDDHFVRGEQRQILKGHPGNIALAIAGLGVDLKYNEFSGQTEISGLARFGPELNDAAAIRLRLLINETFGFLPSERLFEHVLIDLAWAHSFHPVRDWLAGLEWDGVSRIDDWIIKYGGAEDTRFCRAVGRIFLIAGVRRVRKPGAKFDTMLVFESPQGRDKSRALRALAIRDEWFMDNLPLDADVREVIEQTQGVWIVEFAELSGIDRKGAHHVRSFLSRQDDRARRAYGRRSERFPRQFICSGSTNDAQYLLGPERRFWPVSIKRFNVTELEKIAPQLWAEAAHYEAQGESITLQEDLWEAAAVEQAARVIGNPVEEALAAELGRDAAGWIRANEIWGILAVADMQRRSALARAVGAAMTALGFKRKQLGKDDDEKGRRGDRYYERGTGGARICWRSEPAF